MQCKMCGKDGIEVKDGLIAKIIPFDECFICDICIMKNQTKTIEEMVLMINKQKG